MALPLAPLAWLGSLLTGAVAKFIADRVLLWVAVKGLLVLLFTVILPIVLNNFLYDMIEIGSNLMTANAGDVSSMSSTMEFTGLLAWLSDCFNLPECLSVLVGALLLRVTLSSIPFFGLKS